MIPYKMKWASQSTINIARDEELLDLAARSGCVSLSIGLESVNEASLEGVKKGFNQRNRFDRDLKALVEAFMSEAEIAEAYRTAPAAKSLHHAYIGGLLDHVVSLFRSCDLICRNYPQINRDLLLTGAFLHDIGKIHELTYSRSFSYTTRGQLLGHLGYSAPGRAHSESGFHNCGTGRSAGHRQNNVSQSRRDGQYSAKFVFRVYLQCARRANRCGCALSVFGRPAQSDDCRRCDEL